MAMIRHFFGRLLRKGSLVLLALANHIDPVMTMEETGRALGAAIKVGVDSISDLFKGITKELEGGNRRN